MSTRIRAVLLCLGIALAAVALVGPGFAQRLADAPPEPGQELATFAGGCFWCVEADFDKVDGVTRTVSGFMGGTVKNPSYEQVVRGGTGHLEVVQIHFDPRKVSYAELVRIFFRTIDPLDDTGQFCDKGDAYRTAVFAHSPAQRAAAEAEKAKIDASKRLRAPVVTRILSASDFTSAADYHQDFYKKSPARYYSYRAGCGRDARVKSLWGAEAFGGKALTQ
jgi:peptide-methionine (S)-S-oxide reductase